MRVAALIIGIDGWEKYTLPLIRSIETIEPNCAVIVVDNASQDPYPGQRSGQHHSLVYRSERLCYSAAINTAAGIAHPSDWYIVLSNDVLCTGPFMHILESYSGDDLVGPLLKNIHIEQVGMVHYIEGWCVAISRRAWDEIGPWDEGMQISSYEDCDYSHRARKAGFGLVQDLPFVHLDQKQRFYLVPDYWNSEMHNRVRFIEKHGVTG